jgi:predicted ribosome quality control (RQC) complex YloA/Tae2 family protein
MIQTYKNIYNQILSINQFDIKNAQIQKIFSSSTLINLICRKPGKTFSLYLGRGGGTEGIWLDESKVESNLRQIDQFLEYLRKHLTTTYIHKVSVEQNDRLIFLEYIKNKKLNTFGFFYLGRNLYFAHEYFNVKTNSIITYRSWDSEKSDESIHDCFEALINNKINDTKKENKFVSAQNILENEKKSLKKNKTKKTKKLERKISFIKEDLKKMSNYNALYSFADECQDLGTLPKKHTVEGIKISFKEKAHYKRRNELFEKAKKLKAKIPFMKDRLEDCKREYDLIRNKESFLNDLKTIKPFMTRAKKKEVKATKSQKEYLIIETENILMAKGNSASGNDQMRKEWANKDDLWFHVDGEKSAHIIVKKYNLPFENLCEEIAREFAKDLKSNEINLIYTQVKNLKGVKGIRGMVNYKKEKHLRIKL